MGKSRSATLVLAYLLSQEPTLTPNSALQLLRTSRPLVEPNVGFMYQLELYHKMKCPSNMDEQPEYQRWLYQREVELSRAAGQPPDADKIRFEDEHARAVEGVKEEVQTEEAVIEIKCRKCRFVPSYAQDIHSHPIPPAYPTTTPISSFSYKSRLTHHTTTQDGP